MAVTSNGSRSPGPFSKRARELQQSESHTPYRTPSLSPSLPPSQPQVFAPADAPLPLPVVQEDAEVAPAVLSSPPGLSRRPRAGTLPSTFHLGPSPSTPPNSALRNFLGPPLATASLPASGATTPVDEFRYPFLAQQAAVQSRFRSGSLTLPTSGLSNAFGPSLFSSSAWPTPASTSERSDGVRSPDSSMYGDDSHVRTLDYLGLEGDSPLGGFGPFSDHPARGRGISLSLAGGGGHHLFEHQRVRSNTVATFPRTSAVPDLPLPSTVRAAFPSQTDEYFESPGPGGSSNPSSYHRSDSSTDSTRLLYSTSTSVGVPEDHPAPRARAATIGILDESREVFMRKRAGTTAAVQPAPSDEYAGGAASVMARGLRGLSLAHADEQQHQQLGWAQVLPQQERESTPDPAMPAPQQPTRSLWIGNLDPKTSTAELQAVFAPYGAIESLRLIPEKECGFVNFVSISDALHAKEDVLNRLGGRLTKTSGMVRIGFGKADAAPSSLPAPTSDTQSAPTRALWVGSIPASTTPAHLLAIFATFGPVESARVLTHKSCGFVNFERLDDAVAARKALHGRDLLGADVGAVRIGFAKVPTKVGSPAAAGGTSPVQPDEQDFRSNLIADLTARQSSEERVETVKVPPGDLQLLMREISGDSPDTEEHVLAVAGQRRPATYYTSIPQQALTDPALARRYVNADAPRLREIRKRLDSPQITVEEVDSIAYDLVEESVALASDYIGNTLVQKIFERASLPARLALLERIAPHLATIGTHKNGTWAVQKIIQCVQTPDEFAIVEQNLQPYTPPLLLNDFGNYVVQGALRFGTDFIFDAMVDRCWEIGSGRFGARSTRQTLESPRASRLNIKRVAIAIVLNSIPLVTSANGALLVTWLLDTSNLPGRYRLLAPRFAPHLAHLCTHKLASSAVLKIVTQRVDPNASRIILDTLFDPETKTLEEVLGDQVNGAACITKLLSSAGLDGAFKNSLSDRTRTALVSLRVSSVPAYRKLIEDLGLPFQGPAAAPHYPSLPYQPSPPHQWSGQANAYTPYTQYEYNLPPMPYGAYPYQQPGAYPFFVPPPYYAPQSFPSPGAGGRSPMLAPVPTTSGSFSPAMLPAGLPTITSPDPFSALRSGDPHSGFNPAFVNPVLPNPYFAQRHPYGMGQASTLRPEAADYYANPSDGSY